MSEDRSAALPGDRMVAYGSLTPSAIILILLVAVPTITVFAISMQRVEFGQMSGPFIGLDNFIWALTSRELGIALVNTFIWVFGSVALEMILGLGIALLLNRTFLFRGLARAVIMAPYLVPTVVAVLVWRYMFHDIVGVVNYLLMAAGIIDAPMLWLNSPNMAMLSVIIVAVWKFFPFAVLSILGILQSIPQEQYEAAQIDGASSFQQFWRITLPHILPVFILTALLRTIWTFHSFDIIYLLTGGGPVNATTTLSVFVYLKGFVDFELGRAAAIALLTLAIMVVLLAIYTRAMKWAEARQ